MAARTLVSAINPCCFADPLSANPLHPALDRWCFLALPAGGRQGYGQAHAPLPRARACSVALRFVIRPSARLPSTQHPFCEPVPPSLLFLTLIHCVAFHCALYALRCVLPQHQFHVGRCVCQSGAEP